MSKKKLLLLGASGYLGSRLYLELKEDYEVKCVDAGFFGTSFPPKTVCLDYKDLREVELREYPVILLLAGHSTVQMCNKDPIVALQNNVQNFLELTRRLEKQRLIYASSARVYEGSFGNGEHAWNNVPKSYYDLYKLTIDHLASLSSVDYYGLRMPSVCGWSPHLYRDSLINRMYLDALDKGIIHVTHPKRLRPVLGMRDFCRAIQCILQGLPRPGIYNLASFSGSIQDIAHDVGKQLGVRVNLGNNDEVTGYSMSCEKFEKNYGFEFKDTITTILDGLKHNSPLKILDHSKIL